MTRDEAMAILNNPLPHDGPTRLTAMSWAFAEIQRLSTPEWFVTDGDDIGSESEEDLFVGVELGVYQAVVGYRDISRHTMALVPVEADGNLCRCGKNGCGDFWGEDCHADREEVWTRKQIEGAARRARVCVDADKEIIND